MSPFLLLAFVTGKWVSLALRAISAPSPRQHVNTKIIDSGVIWVMWEDYSRRQENRYSEFTILLAFHENVTCDNFHYKVPRQRVSDTDSACGKENSCLLITGQMKAWNGSSFCFSSHSQLNPNASPKYSTTQRNQRNGFQCHSTLLWR